LETWAVHDADRVVRRGVDRRRASIKRHIGAGLGPEMTTLPFEAADIRFLGHPAHFVVFDGHTQVKDGHVAELAEVVFVMMRPEAEADAALIDECLRAGRVRWSTLRRSGDLLEQNGPGP
jgi:predicted Holliday junction resolvase-like endonuclease